MQLLPLLFVSILCLLVAEAAGDDGDRPLSHRRHRPRVGKLSPEAKKRLAQKIGNLDARKARLARLKGPKPLTAEQKAKLQERLAKLPRISEEDEEALHDPIAVNMEEGVTDYFYEGDIDLTEEQLNQLLASDSARSKRQVSSIATKWTNNTVYYFFDWVNPLPENTKRVVREAIEFLEARTCIKFIENATAQNRVGFYKGNGCSSRVGMTSGQQGLSLSDGCAYLDTAVHEIMHALGIGHMQSRTDRDDYITVDLSVVNPDYQHNFAKRMDFINYTPYEFGSVMHYYGSSFSNTSGKFSILPHDIEYYPYMRGHEPSFLDVLMINKHYGCDAACPPATSAKCKFGGVPNIYNCSVCSCPYGYGGTLCDQRPPGCGETLTASANWQFTSSSYNSKNNTKSYCVFWINVPEGYNTEIQFVSMTGANCEYSCRNHGVEIKRVPDTRLGSPKYCCPTFTQNVTLSSINPTPVIIYNQKQSTNFTFKYRAVPSTVSSTTTLPTTTPSTTKPPTKCPSTTKSSTTTPTTTAPPSTKSPIVPPVRHCHSLYPDFCSTVKKSGFCNMPKYTFAEKKRYCGVECGLCGKPVEICEDRDPLGRCPEEAANGYCQTTWDPMAAEYWCAKTCGYCEYPN